VTLRNTDLQPVELVLRLPRKTASLTLRFRFAQPMPEDGIKLAPRVCGAFKQKQKASEQH